MPPIRRTDRAVSISEARAALARAEWGVLSTLVDSVPYGVPMSFCLIENDIYFHCAVEGRKIEGLFNGAPVSFCAVASTRVLPEQFGTLYESAIAEGAVFEVFGEEKHRGLEGLLQKYSPNHLEEGARYIETKGPRSRVFKICIKELTGKSRKK